jgi:peptidoglycan/LPS O-acetylase OafA/YrhL
LDDPTSPEAQAELARRHKAASTTVAGLLIAVVLLAIVAFVSRPYLAEKPPNWPLDYATRFLVLFFGLGAIVWRRNRFSPMRLRDISGLAGVSGLLKTLEKTTIQLALMAVAIAIIGFIVTLIQGNELYTYWACAIAVVVLIYCYPTRSSWQRTAWNFAEPVPDVSSESAPPSSS